MGSSIKKEMVYARPPPGEAQRFINGVPIAWRLLVPLYGEGDAGRIENRTLRIVQMFKQSQYDPCMFFE